MPDLVNQGLADGLGPRDDALRGADPVARGGRGAVRARRLLRPEMLIAARAMQGALDILRPLLAQTGAQPIGTS